MADSVLHEAVERVHLTVPLHCCIRMECHKPQVLRGRRLQSVKLGITSSTAPFIEPESRRTRRIEITSSRKRMRKNERQTNLAGCQPHTPAGSERCIHPEELQ